MEHSNQWAAETEAKLTAALARVTEVQEELARDQENAQKVVAGYNAKIAALEAENREKTKWAQDTETRLTAEIQAIADEHAKVIAALEQKERELEERTEWALRLDDERRQVEEQLGMVRASRWIKLGRKVGLGPAL
jgi:septal ring factor EnvC (AmiA/AmiB activator)